MSKRWNIFILIVVMIGIVSIINGMIDHDQDTKVQGELGVLMGCLLILWNKVEELSKKK